ncbi:MAG: NTP transferase domain-containing protein [Clostridia bacterium]|nr:NTP transferase domain-containing protein [Clostridia bacterium]
MKTVIMAGGRGTRMQALFPEFPKPMIPIGGRPVLEWQICSLREQGLTDLILTVSYRADQIMNAFGDGRRWGVHIDYVVEREPLGTAGALFGLLPRLGTEPFLLMNADSIFEVDFGRFADFHRKQGYPVTLLAHGNDHPGDSSLLITSPEGIVREWLTPEEKRPEWARNCVNAGLHILDPAILSRQAGTFVGAVDLDRQVLKPLCATGEMICYPSWEYARDMGTPERYGRVCRDFSSGVMEARHVRNRQRAVFIDRDLLIRFRSPDAFALLPGAGEAVRRINAGGCLVFAVETEMDTFPEEEIRRRLDTLLVREGAALDGYIPAGTGVEAFLNAEGQRIDPEKSFTVGKVNARIGAHCSGLTELVRQMRFPD